MDLKATQNKGWRIRETIELERRFVNMIRNGNYAIYKGMEYYLTREMDSDRIKIYTHDKRKVDETFMQCNRPDEQECYERYVQLWELGDTYSVVTFVIEGEKDMTIATESADMYCVCVGSEDQDLIEKYHFREADRGIYMGWIYKEGTRLREVITPLNLKEAEHLKDRESLPGKGIRKTVPKVKPDTYLQKVIPAEEIPKYLGEDGYSTIQGFVARYGDVSHIKGYGNVVESFHLNDLVDGRRLFPENGDSYGYIKFKLTTLTESQFHLEKNWQGQMRINRHIFWTA